MDAILADALASVTRKCWMVASVLCPAPAERREQSYTLGRLLRARLLPRGPTADLPLFSIPRPDRRSSAPLRIVRDWVISVGCRVAFAIGGRAGRRAGDGAARGRAMEGWYAALRVLERSIDAEIGHPAIEGDDSDELAA